MMIEIDIHGILQAAPASTIPPRENPETTRSVEVPSTKRTTTSILKISMKAAHRSTTVTTTHHPLGGTTTTASHHRPDLIMIGHHIEIEAHRSLRQGCCLHLQQDIENGREKGVTEIEIGIGIGKETGTASRTLIKWDLCPVVEVDDPLSMKRPHCLLFQQRILGQSCLCWS
jgi:hypothetical protein